MSPINETRMDAYLKRREAVWCAAFATAIVQEKTRQPSIDETTLRSRAIALAGLAVALMPGVPGEEERLSADVPALKCSVCGGWRDDGNDHAHR